MVWSLEEIQDVEDLQLLSGYISMLLGNVGKAQVLLCIYKFRRGLLLFYFTLGFLFEIYASGGRYRHAY